MITKPENLIYFLFELIIINKEGDINDKINNVRKNHSGPSIG